MNDIKIELPKAVLKIFKIIKEYGAESFVVGGCVRDSILNREIHDWDICSPVPVCELAVMFREKGYHVIETGLQHGTITVVIDGEGYEITTYRKDGDYSDGRHPNYVEFVSDLEEDLARRDFTINAMAYNPEVGLVDPFNGLYDIEHKTIRCVGNPYDRFNEDGLRIMRALRFAAQLDFYTEYKTSNAIIELVKNLDSISVERINSELCKILKSKNLENINEDILCQIIPEFKNCIGFEQNNPYHCYTVDMHTGSTLIWDDSNDLIVRLTLLFHDIGKPHCYQEDEDGTRHFKGHGKISSEMTDKIMRRLKFDNDTREKVVELVYFHDATIEVGKKYVRRWLNILGEEQFKRLLQVRKADIKAQSELNKEERLNKLKEILNLLDEIIAENECYNLKDLAINGKDLIKIGYNPGKELGKVLNGLLDAIIDGNLNNDKETLLQIARCSLINELNNSSYETPRMNVPEYMK